MYTRSYGRRDTPLPPDYGGTALTVKPPSEEAPVRAALTRQSSRGSAKGRDITPRRLQYDEESYRIPSDDIIDRTEAPFGILGQNGEGEEYESEPTSDTTAASLPEHGKRPLIDLSKLKTDDLILLGLAFLIFTDKDREGDIPIDALMIIAVLFLSGL